MGRKNKTNKVNTQHASEAIGIEKKHILSPQKRHELNVNVKELLKITTRMSQEKCDLPTINEIHKIITKIEQLECSDLPFPGDRSDFFNDLLQWVQKEKGNVNNVLITTVDDMEYGLVCNKDFNREDLITTVPRTVMMTTEDVQDSEMQQLAQSDKILSVMNNVKLAIFLCFEALKGTKSFWAPYILSLPRTYNTILYFTPDDFKLLKGSSVFEPALLQYSHIARQYAYLKNLFEYSHDPASLIFKNSFSYNLYRWAVSTVLTRQNMIPSKDGTCDINALIPVWDMCNHMPGPISTGYNQELDASECYASESFPKGSQIYISYGIRSNADFFIHNGFIPNYNPHDTYRLKLGISKADPLQQFRSRALSRLNLPSCGEFPLKAGPDPIEGDLLAFLRIFSMEKDDLIFWEDSDRPDDLKFMDCALDTRVENRMWSFFVSRLKLLLSVYSDLHQNETRSACGTLAVKVVTAEKKLLENTLEYARLKAEH